MGGDSSSEKRTENTTNVTTETTTNIRDVGLTGANAVELAKTLDQGATSRQSIAADTVKTLSQQASSGFQNLVGGAGAIVDSANERAAETGKSSRSQAGALFRDTLNASLRLLGGAQEQASEVRGQAAQTRQSAAGLFEQSGEAQQETVQLVKSLAPVILIPVALALLPMFMRGK